MTYKQKQTNFTSGVFDPYLYDREDNTFYYNALADGKNLIVLPQGGITRRPGCEFVKELTRQLEEIDLSGATITAPNGGTVGNLIDGSASTDLITTSNIGTTNPYVVFHVDLGAADTVCAVDCVNFVLSSGAVEDEFKIQYSTNNSTWSDFGASFDIDASDRSRRAKGSSPVSARYWRFVRDGATDLTATISVQEIHFWKELDALSNGRLLPFSYSTEQSYMLATSDQNIDIFVGDEYKTAVSIDHTSLNQNHINFTQSLDTLIMFHSDVAPVKLFRQGSDDQFDFRNVEFENIPNYDFGAGVGGVDEVQRINISDAFTTSDKFTILLEGERTAVINGNGTASTMASNIQAALRGLSNTSSDGITVSSVTDGYQITFGGDDGKRPWSKIEVSVLKGNMVMDISRTTKGEYPGEPIMSETRGYPRAGSFYQERLHMGGFKSLPDALLSSAVSEFYNFDIDRDDDTKGLLFRATDDQANTIYQIVNSRHLSVFTDNAEYYFPSEPIDENAVFKKTTSTGSKEGLRVFEVEGALVFVQGVFDESSDDEKGTSLREFIFVDTEQSYQAPNLSKLSGHLIKNPVDMALRKSVSTEGASNLLMVNEDGTITCNTIMRSDAVNAFMPHQTRGGDKFLAVGVDKKRRVYFITERIINGEARRFIEKWNDDLLLDAGGVVTIEAESFTAASDQTDFIWTFDNPASADAIGVRLNGARLDADEYSVDLGSKTVTLNEGSDQGDIVRVSFMIDQISGLDHLEGETVQVIFDGTPDENITISGGVLDLGKYADTEIQYGFNFEVYGDLMPFSVPEAPTLQGEKIRVVKAFISLKDTGDIAIRANLRSWKNLNLIQYDTDIADRSAEELLYSGTFEATSLLGYAEGGRLEFRQDFPAPLTILSITREVSL